MFFFKEDKIRNQNSLIQLEYHKASLVSLTSSDLKA